MITSDTVGLIKARLQERSDAARPQVAMADMVIRSGDQLFFRAPLHSRLSKAEKKRLLAQMDPSTFDPDEGDDADDELVNDETAATGRWKKAAKRMVLAPIVAEFGYDIKNADKFQTFLAVYEPKLAELAPSGVRYRGTYIVNSSTEKTAGDYRTIWSFRSVAALNRIGKALKASGGIDDFGGLMQKFKSHVDDAPGAGRSQVIYQVAWGTVRGF
jgi:hypothetical protein